jgi:hypothetical protein
MKYVGQAVSKKQTPDELPPQKAVAREAPRNSLGMTWDQYEQRLRRKFASLGPKVVEREVQMQKEIFARHSAPNPVVEERKRLFDEAYEAVPPAQRRHFLEGVKKFWT